MKWKHEINIRPILNNDETSLAEKAKLMKEILLISPFIDKITDKNYLHVVTSMFETAGISDDVEEFDDGLKMLYDWADRNKIWLGI